MKTEKILSREQAKKKIIQIFYANVKGNKPSYEATINQRHDGKEGHWLEGKMGIKRNRNTRPDLHGFEMKKETRGKTTFGDWSADYYIFKSRNNKESEISRDQFLKMFGKANSKKKGRYSWSGEPFPKVGVFNSFGQKLFVDKKGNIKIVYNYKKDMRDNKDTVVDLQFRINNQTLAIWYYENLKSRVEDKFNSYGWFKCCKDRNGVYTSIKFGKPFDITFWLESVRNGKIYLDSGMFQGNTRNYSSWRANNSLWDELVVECY